MSAYNKMFAAIISTLLMRWLLRYLEIDAESIGIASELNDMVGMGLALAMDVGQVLIDFVVVAVNGFFVWLVPNVKKDEYAATNEELGLDEDVDVDDLYGDTTGLAVATPAPARRKRSTTKRKE